MVCDTNTLGKNIVPTCTDFYVRKNIIKPKEFSKMMKLKCACTCTNLCMYMDKPTCTFHLYRIKRINDCLPVDS